MTDDRASFGARIAEAMGLEERNGVYWLNQSGGGFINPEAFVTWWGYGIVDAWMREQGYSKTVYAFATGTTTVEWSGKHGIGAHADLGGDEPYAALQAALKALEARE